MNFQCFNFQCLQCLQWFWCSQWLIFSDFSDISAVNFPSLKLNFLPDFTLDLMVDFMRLLMIDDKLNGKLLVKRVGKIDGFRFGSLDGLFPVKLAVNLEVKNPVKLDDFYDPLDKGGDTIEARPPPIPLDWNF